MDLNAIPLTFRYILHAKPEFDRTGATVWQCANCALRAIPVGEKSFITDRMSTSLMQVFRQKETRFMMRRYSRRDDGSLVPPCGHTEFSIPDTYQHDGSLSECLSHRTVDPIPFGRGSDDVQELATVSSVERFLYPNGGDAQ